MFKAVKFLLAVALFAGASSTAFASTLTGTLNLNGTYKVIPNGQPGAPGVTYTTNPVTATGGTGSLTGVTGSPISFVNTFSFNGITAVTGELLFFANLGGHPLQFYVTSYTYSGSTITFFGYITDNGGTISNATLVDKLGTVVTGPGAGNMGNYFTGTLSLTPEPNSVVLLGTGLLAACGMIAVKRRRTLTATI